MFTHPPTQTPTVPFGPWPPAPHLHSCLTLLSRQLLTTLELPFKTVKGVTVDEVASRLVPCGFYRDTNKPPAEYGPHLLLDNITKYVGGPEGRRETRGWGFWRSWW